MTYSIVARDKKTGQLGVAVQTHWFGVGNNVPWLESGVGAIATQAQTNMDYGKKGLKFLEQGKTPEETFREIAKNDDALKVRQVAILDNHGNTFAHTGGECLKYADYYVGDNFIVQGNILTNQNVIPAMKKAYEENIDIDFAESLYLCLKAGEEAGGELRGVQSAALRIVPGISDAYDVIDLRIDDHEAPLTELKRQLDLQKAYNLLIQAEEAGFTGTYDESLDLFSQAFTIIPDNEEFLFWKAFMLQNNGKQEEAEEIFSQFAENSKWQEMKKRLQ